MNNNDTKVRNKPELQDPNSKFQIPRSKIQYPRSKIQIPRSKIQISNFKFQGWKSFSIACYYQFLNFQFQTLSSFFILIIAVNFLSKTQNYHHFFINYFFLFLFIHVYQRIRKMITRCDILTCLSNNIDLRCQQMQIRCDILTCQPAILTCQCKMLNT